MDGFFGRTAKKFVRLFSATFFVTSSLIPWESAKCLMRFPVLIVRLYDLMAKLKHNTKFILKHFIQNHLKKYIFINIIFLHTTSTKQILLYYNNRRQTLKIFLHFLQILTFFEQLSSKIDKKPWTARLQLSYSHLSILVPQNASMQSLFLCFRRAVS